MSVIDLGSLAIAMPDKAVSRAESFESRSATIERIDTWLHAKDESLPWLLLAGEPGAGKSTLMAWLAGAGPAPHEPTMAARRERIRSAVVAVHFCDADGGRAAASLDPLQFSMSIARQLSRRFPNYAAAYLEGLRIHLNVRIDAHQAGTVIGAEIHGDIHAQSPAAVFNCVLAPLLTGAIAGIGGPMLLLVDALDEATLWRGHPKIPELIASIEPHAARAAGLHLLTSSRPVPEVIEAFPPAALWTLGDDGAIVAYAKRRLEELGCADAKVLAERIHQASGGNFLYAKYVVDDLAVRPQSWSQGATAQLPKDLDDVYATFLRREYGADPTEWATATRPVVATIGTALEPLQTKQLRWLLEPRRKPLEPSIVEIGLRRCSQYLDGALPDGPFELYHRSFREFLFDPARSREFAVDEPSWHGLVAERFGTAYRDDWHDCHDPYGLRHTLTHLAEATRLSEPPARHEYAGQLVELVRSESYLHARMERFDEPWAVLDDLYRALEACARDDHSEAVVLVVESVAAISAFGREQVQPRLIFELARRGALAQARDRLSLHAVEHHWREAMLRICIWLAIPVAPEAARALDLELDEYPEDPLPLLRKRVRAALGTGSDPSLPFLPQVPLELAQLIVRRMKEVDATNDPSMLAYESTQFGEYIMALGLRPTGFLARHSHLHVGNNHAPMFLSEREAPLLVATAIEQPEQEELLQEYIELHAANEYELYRNRSLWGILKAVLRHPDPAWVVEYSAELAVRALAGTRLAFTEALPLSILALRAAAGLDDARSRWSARIDQALENAGSLYEARGHSDSVGAHKRRLAVIAELLHYAHSGERVEAFIERLLCLPMGFAGFQSPACLALAESLAIVAPLRETDIVAVLDSARAAAHNVQDPVFCARTTARYNAIREHWWGPGNHPLAGSFDVLGAVERLVAGAGTEGFAALHVVGELYCDRTQGPDSVDLPPWMRNAVSLRELAMDVYQQPLADFVRLNRGLDEHAPLQTGTRVRVPDPVFPSLLAARLSAELVRRPRLDPRARRAAMLRLVPVAARHPTSLDIVLARLLMVARPRKPRVLARLTELADSIADVVPEDAAVVAEGIHRLSPRW